MARSEYAYVVMRSRLAIPVAVFTVKHELRRWLVRQDTERYRVYRYRDAGTWGWGVNRKPTEMTVAEIVEGK